MKFVSRFCVKVIFFILLIPINSRAQHDTLFVNEIGAIIQKEKASYYRILKELIPGNIEVKEYFLNNKLHFIGHFTNEQANLKQGNFVYYNLDGYKSSEGNYTNGFKDSEWVYFFDEGRQIKEREIYSYPKKGFYNIVYEINRSSKLKEGWMDQFGKKTGNWIEYFPNSDSIKLKTTYDAGSRMGEQLEYYETGKLKRKELWNKSVIEKGEMFDEHGKKIKYYPAIIYPKPPEYLTKYIDVRVKCFNDLIKKTNISYKLKVLKDGSVSEVELPDLPESECKTEIIKVLSEMRKWKPAKAENKPINFTLDGFLKYRLHNE